MSDDPTVWVFVETESVVQEIDGSGKRGGFEDTGPNFAPPGRAVEAIRSIATRQRIPLDAKMLREQMVGLLAVVGDLFEQSSQQDKMQLDELTLSVEIDGEGKVGFAGSGAKLGNSGGITMKFKSR